MASTSAGAGAKGGGGHAVLIGVAIVLLIVAGGVLCWAIRRGPEDRVVTTVTSASATPATTLDLPALEVPADAGDDAPSGADADAKVAPTGVFANCPVNCEGTPTDAVKQAVNARAGTAKQCYKTALEANEGLAGDMAVVVRVGADGSTCMTSIASDNTGSSRLQQCVRQKMIAVYPQPKGGCVDVRVPIFFKQKT